MSDEGYEKHFFIDSAADVANVDQKFEEMVEFLRKAYLDPEGCYAIYIYNPNDEDHNDSVLENVMIGKIHPLGAALFWALILGSVMEGTERWAAMMTEEMRRSGEE